MNEVQLYWLREKSMKFLFQNTRKRMRQYWENRMNSVQKKLSAGASQLFRIIPWARRDNWRRDDKKQHRG